MAKAITLPPELIDLIISFLVIPHKCRTSKVIPHKCRTSKPSQTTLYSCSLVCRQWRELARLHIFHTVALRFVHNEYGRITLEDFLIFLEATPHVPPCIRRLELDFFEGFIDESRQGILEKPPASIDLVLLHAVLSRLPRLHSLLLGSFNPFNATPGDWAPTPIHLRYIDCNALGDILLFLEMFGNVDELVMGINQNYGSVSQVAQRVAGLSHLRLRSLKLRASSCSPSHIASFTEGILLTPLLNTLDSLTLMNFNTEGSLAAARRLLRGVGPQLLGVCIYVSDQLASKQSLTCHQHAKTN
ncbi:hypothetical protein PHLCEN_2v13127 [Hermanssonia centrifuga]|uniref:Uncharacterized protein n=1 Tax=Hermanssonia centrifuga TaxID=98765 RepID=A0A2R6NF76_9APHY|nr:hypothetical protein PHLCEN_2v13127 [Hermanssonia centrifuga]